MKHFTIRVAVGFCVLTFILSVIFGLVYLSIAAGLMIIILGIFFFMFILGASALLGTIILDW